MNYKRYIPFSLLASALLMLAGCATDNAADEPVNGKDDTQFWIQFQMSGLQESQPAKESGELTRSEEIGSDVTRAVDPSKTENEVKIKSLVGLLFDCNNDTKETPKTLVAVKQADPADIVGPTNKVTTVKLNMGLNSFYTRKKKYRLYVFANLPESAYSALEGMKSNSYTQVAAKYATLAYQYSESIAGKVTDISDSGIPLGTTLDDGLKIMVWLKEGEEYKYDSENPYIVQVNSTDPENAADNAATLNLTPMQARFDIVAVDKPGITDFTYPVNFNDGTSVKPEVKVQLTNYCVVTPSHNTFYFQNGTETGKTLTSPTTLPTSTIMSALTKLTGSVYVPEFIPSVAGDKKLKYKDVTYVIMRGKLVADDNCTVSNKIKDYIKSCNESTISAHPLYYYDDGQFQSALTEENHDGQTNWHKITWDADVDGYGVKYYHAVRHIAGSDDDTYSALEYGVVRNYIYQIGVESINALPHPFTESTTPVENPNKDISLRITPQDKWIYHRIGTSIKF